MAAALLALRPVAAFADSNFVYCFSQVQVVTQQELPADAVEASPQQCRDNPPAKGTRYEVSKPAGKPGEFKTTYYFVESPPAPLSPAMVHAYTRTMPGGQNVTCLVINRGDRANDLRQAMAGSGMGNDGTYHMATATTTAMLQEPPFADLVEASRRAAAGAVGGTSSFVDTGVAAEGSCRRNQ